MKTAAQNYALLSQLGLLEGVKAGALQQSAAQTAAIAALALVTAPDATDPASTQTLANANKVAINAIIAALKTA